MMKPLNLLSLAAAVLTLCSVPAQAQKTSALPEATSADSADILRFVDVSDTSLAATGTDKRITIGNLSLSLSALNASALTTGTVPTARLASPLQAVVNNSGTLDLSGVTLTLPTGTGGAPAGSGTELQYRNGSSFGAIPGSSWDGTKLTLLGAGFSFAGSSTLIDGDVRYITYSGTNALRSEGLWLGSNSSIVWNSGAAYPPTTGDIVLTRSGAGSLSMINGPNAQSFGVYSFSTDISNGRAVYMEGSVWDSGNPGITAAGAGTGANPELWLNAQAGVRLHGSILFHGDSEFGIGGTSAGTDTDRPVFINVGNQGVISQGDFEVTDSNKGVVLKSPSGNRYRLKVDDDGVLSTEQIF